jgi:hypothetical protein
LEVDCDEKLSEMEDFIQFFNNISRKARVDIDPIDEGWWTQQKKHVWAEFKTEFKTMLPGKRFDPPFIVMIEVLLKKYGEHLADSRR